MCNHHHNKNYTRRDFLTKTSLGMGALSMASMLDPMGLFAKENLVQPSPLMGGGLTGIPHFPPRGQTRNLPFSEWSTFAVRPV